MRESRSRDARRVNPPFRASRYSLLAARTRSNTVKVDFGSKVRRLRSDNGTCTEKIVHSLITYTEGGRRRFEMKSIRW